MRVGSGTQGVPGCSRYTWIFCDRILSSGRVLKKILDSDPTNLEGANHYWVELASLGSHDCRSGGFVIEAFRGCALASHAGVVAFARAYRELFEKSGEIPRAELFDEELLRALKTRLADLSHDDQAIVQWVLTSIE
jgi:hypothetical protein